MQYQSRGDVESTVLGCMIRSISLLIEGCEKLDESDFSTICNKNIFKVLKEFYNSKANYIDSTLVFSKIENIKGNKITKDYIHSLYSIGQPIKFLSHIEALKDINSKEKIRTLFDDAKSSSFLYPIDKVVEDVVQSLIKIEQSHHSVNILSIKDVLESKSNESKNNILDKIKDIHKNPKNILSNSVPTGFVDLDSMIGGLGKSNMVILAARPSMGKTGFALNIAENLAKSNHSIGFISLEMSPEQLLYRIISSESEVPVQKLMKGVILKDEIVRIEESIDKIKDYKIYIEEMGATSMSRLASTVRKMKHINGIDVLIIDYIQLLSYSSKSSHLENRQQEISNISRAVKLMAKDLNICILCLSQLSRKVEERPDKRPRLSDLRDSGSLEQDADQVLLLYRPEYYSSDKEVAEISSPQINVAKNRHGSTGIVNLTFRPNIVKFGDITNTSLLH